VTTTLTKRRGSCTERTNRMADRLIELTRVDGNPAGTPALVNLDNVAWMELNETGSTRITFIVALARERAHGEILWIDVRESLREIAEFAGLERKSTNEAIAQAWADQSARHDQSDESGEVAPR
jgi:hypothetical protein